MMLVRKRFKNDLDLLGKVGYTKKKGLEVSEYVKRFFWKTRRNNFYHG